MKKLLQKYLYDKTGTYKISILTSPLFIVGLIVKLYASAFFAGTNFGTLFVPFLKQFVLYQEGPYSHFFNLGITEVFPYPQLMLYIMALPGMLVQGLLTTDIFSISTLELFIYHLPILLADVCILLVLARWLPGKHTALLWLYWLSPVLFYINYLHSQLDVIPMALVFLFLHFLFRERWVLSSLFLAAAIATKIHILILLPFVLVYLVRKHNGTKLLLLFASTVTLFFVFINNKLLLSESFITIVFNNREQFKVLDLHFALGGQGIIYIIPLAYTLLFFHSLYFTHFNRDTFVMFLGFSFGILTLFIAPQPGWYYWTVPFLIYFYCKNTDESRLPFIWLTLSYFVYFGLTETSDYLSIFVYSIPSIATLPNIYTLLVQNGIPAETVSNIGLTILQATLLINVFWLYQRGVAESKKSKLYNMPYLVGVAGDSGSGKSTLAKLLRDIFGETNLALAEGDAMHKWERGHKMWGTLTHLNPKANNLHADVENARALQSGNHISRRHYDHSSGTFTLPERLNSKKVILFEGLHSFYLTHMRQALDLKIFILPEEQLRIHWKLRRDVHERGYKKDAVLTALKKREADSIQYIRAQEKYADIIVSLKCKTPITTTLGDDIDPSVYLEIKCDNAIPMDALLDAIGSDVSIEHKFEGNMQIIKILNDIDATIVEQISFTLVPEIYDILMKKPVWSSNYNGVLQLFICYYILQTLKHKPSHGA